jgi:hypothetical protein
MCHPTKIELFQFSIDPKGIEILRDAVSSLLQSRYSLPYSIVE